jgi:HD-like signal output (HDOD) protein
MLLAPRTPALGPSDLIHRQMKLPSPPAILARLMPAIEAADSKGLRPVGEIIGRDASLSARLLKVANSPFYGLPRRTASIDQALVLLGLQALQGLVVSTLVIERFSNLPGMTNMNGFWADSLKCGICARLLGSQARGGTNLEALFLCGLLHDIGRLVVFAQLPEPARAAHLEARSGAITENAAIRTLLGFDYYQVGAELSTAWKLPEILAATQRHHDAPTEADEFQRESAIVALAHGIVTTGADGSPTASPELRDYLRMEPADLKRILGEAEGQLGEALALFFPAR